MTPVELVDVVLAHYSTGSELVRRSDVCDSLVDLRNQLERNQAEEEALLAVILEDRETR